MSERMSLRFVGLDVHKGTIVIVGGGTTRAG